MKELSDETSRVAREVYDLEWETNGNHYPGALEAAVLAALRQHEQELIERAAKAAEQYAEELYQHEGNLTANDQGNALSYFADKLRKDFPTLSSETNYQPADNDCVDVRLRGYVKVETSQCENCGHHEYQFWTLTTDSGNEYSFEDEDIQVRKVTSL